MANSYGELTDQAMADCEAGRFAEAETKLMEVLKVEKSMGMPLGSSKAAYWWLVAKHKGDKQKAMAEWVKL